MSEDKQQHVVDYDHDTIHEHDTSAGAGTGTGNDLELEVVPDRMTTPDDSVEADYDIVEVAHTPGFGDESTVTSFKRIATVFSGNMSLICSTLGTGILGLPYALYELGMIPGVILIVVLGLICVWTMWMLEEVGVALCKEEQVKDNTLVPKVNISYTWVGARVSPKTGVFLDLIMFIIAAGIIIAFVIAFCDSFTSIMKYAIDGADDSSSSSSSDGLVSSSGDEAFYKKMLKSRIFWAIVMYVIDVPMSYAKSLNSLRYFSFFVIPCVIYFIIIFIYFTATDGTKSVNYAPESVNGIKAIPIVMFIYTGHMNYYNVFQELGPKERKKRSLEAAVLSTGIVTVVYVVVAVLGYLYCGDSIKGNVFMSMPNDSVLVIIARIAIAINVMIGFPFIVCPGREGCNTFISEICKKYGDLSPNLKHVIGTTILLVLGVVGWFVTSISIVFSFCGAIGSSAISFIFPGIYYFYTFRNEPTRKISRVLSVVCIVLGFVLMILGVVLQIVDLAS